MKTRARFALQTMEKNKVPLESYGETQLEKCRSANVGRAPSQAISVFYRSLRTFAGY